MVLAAASLALGLADCSGRTIPASSPAGQAAPATVLPPVTETPVPVAPEPAGPLPLAPGEKLKVAMLLPLSGPNAGLGRGMLDAAQMALFDLTDARMSLMPRDTGGTAEGAAAAASAVLDQGARLIIGPLIAAEVEAVKPVARARGVPVLAFSTAANLAGNGTYLLGFLPQEEVARVTAYTSQQGAHRFAALAPGNAYGHLTVDALKTAADAHKVEVAATVFLEPGAFDFSPSVGELKSAAHGDGGFDALLLPEGGQQIKTLAPLLPYNGFDPAKVHFLGTGLWDDPALATEPELQGAWYAAPDPAGRADFEKRFADIYGRSAPRLATLAYDATALAAALAHGDQGPDFSAGALTNPSGFIGLDGIFRLRPDGLIERGLAVIEIRRAGPAVVSPAPKSFENLGL